MAITAPPPVARPAEPAASDPPGAPVGRGSAAPVAWLALGAVVLVKCVLNLAVADRYGWHRDELYYRAAGQHPMLGYTDFLPVVPMIARLAEWIFGPSLVGLRTFAVAAGAATIVVTALIARELGGRRWAQTVAALGVAPMTVGSNAMFQTVSFDQLAWALVLWATIRVLRDGTTRSWAWLGLAVGSAFLVKYTVVVLLLVLAIGFLVTPTGRDRLRGPGVLYATGIALVMVAPNLWWQAVHGWPSVDFFTGRNAEVRDEYPPLLFVAEFLIIASPSALGLWVAGARRLIRDRALRAVGLAVAIVPVAYLLLGGKGYYAVPVVIVAYGAGAAHWEERISRFWRRALPVVLVVAPLAFSPMILPMLPEARMVDAGLADVRNDYAEQMGWPGVAAAVARGWNRLDATERRSAAIVAADYGEAGAIEVHGRALGLPAPVSGHLSYRYWTPSEETLRATTLIVIGYSLETARSWCERVEVVATVPAPRGVDNEEAGGPILECQLPGTLADLWPTLARP